MGHTHSQMIGRFETSELERLDLVPLEVSNRLDSVVRINFGSLEIFKRRLR